MSKAEFTSASFYNYLSENRLMGSRCQRCDALYLPPRPICIKCYSTDMEWVQLAGQGKLVAFTTIAVGTSLMVEAGYDRDRHYCSGIVELEEGPRISAQLVGVDTQKPNSIKIGAPLVIEFPDKGNRLPIVTFRVE